MKKGDPRTNGSELNKNKNNNIKSTLDHLSEEDRKAIEAYHKEVDEIFLSRYEVTRQGLIQKDVVSINICKSKVTPEVWFNPSLSLNDVQLMINSTLERQAKSNNEMMHRLIEERHDKKFVDPNVHAFPSSCTINFAQINPQSSGTLVGGTSQPNSSAQLMNHFNSRTTIDGLTPDCGMPQQTTINMFEKAYMPATPSFLMPNPRSSPYTSGCNS
jgi:hypothetical protein